MSSILRILYIFLIFLSTCKLAVRSLQTHTNLQWHNDTGACWFTDHESKLCLFFFHSISEIFVDTPCTIAQWEHRQSKSLCVCAHPGASRPYSGIGCGYSIIFWVILVISVLTTVLFSLQSRHTFYIFHLPKCFNSSQIFVADQQCWHTLHILCYYWLQTLHCTMHC